MEDLTLRKLFPAMDPWVQNLPNLFPAWLAADSEWALALFGAMHLLALAGLGGCALILALRMMGANLVSIPAADLQRILRPWFYGAVLLGLATGVVMGMATGSRNYDSPSFILKVLAMISGVVLVFGCVNIIARQDQKDLGFARIWAMVASNAWLGVALAVLVAGRADIALTMALMAGVAAAAPPGPGRMPAVWAVGAGLVALALMNWIPTLAFYEKGVIDANGVALLQSNGKPVLERTYYWHLLTEDTKRGLMGLVAVVVSESVRIITMRRVFATETPTGAATYTLSFAIAFWVLAMWLFAGSFAAKPGAVLIAAAAFMIAIGLSGLRTRLALVAILLVGMITVAAIGYSSFPLEAKCPIPMPPDDAAPEAFDAQLLQCTAFADKNRLTFNTMHMWAVRLMALIAVGVLGWRLFGPPAKQADAAAQTANVAKIAGLATLIVWLTVGALGRWIAFAS